MDDTANALDPLLSLWDTLPGGELNRPPDYPKQPGEPPQVQPSKKVAEHGGDDGNRIVPGIAVHVPELPPVGLAVTGRRRAEPVHEGAITRPRPQ